ncbi:MAG: hypothetical protein QOF78_3033, partial [Phycisphaerales bacterium]|nr:hypothetical protein [Phycisphaerales bacterium]
RSILFRGPTHLRESSGGRYEPIEALQRHQWAAFLRSLMVFREAKWMNHPAATYLAENKPYQLATASKLGFHVPHSRIANHVPPNVAPESRSVAVKALDSFLLRLADTDAFFYTQIVEREELCRGDLQSMPLIIQSPLEPKIDLRVTVVGSEVFAVAVTKNGRGIRGDWRLHKEKAEFPPHELPSEVCAKCRNLVEALGLAFGAIDLALVNGEYYFIEINPTGEWAWLCDSKVPIDRAVVDWLAG